MTDEQVRDLDVRKLHDGTWLSVHDAVAHEEPLEMQINGHAVAVVMRTPGHDFELTTGFLLTERIITHVTDVVSMRHCTTVLDPEAEDNIVQVRLRDDVPLDFERLRRHSFASSSCGVCGKATIAHACATAGALDDATVVDASVLLALPARLREQQIAFARTGGLHAAALCDVTGTPIVVREDVGRHNAVDKCIGFAAKDGADATMLFVSGRVSFEIVQKAAAARVPIIAAVSAPTSLAVRVAAALNITLVGFVRGTDLNVYAGAQRLV